MGKFVEQGLYKKGENLLDFNKKFTGTTTEGDYEVKHYSVPSFVLSLDVTLSDYNDKFDTNQISEDDFNQ